MLWAIFGALLMGCSDEEIAWETPHGNAIGFNVLSNAAETRATPYYQHQLEEHRFRRVLLLRRMVLPSWERSTRNLDMTEEYRVQKW